MASETKTGWVRSEDAGYGAGALLLDGPGGHWSVYRVGRKWVAAWVENQVCRNHPVPTFATRREAMAYAESH